MAQEVAVGARVEKAPVYGALPLAHRQCERAVGKARFDLLCRAAEQIVGKAGVFAALQDEGAKAQLVACFAAAQDLLRREPVALGGAVRGAQAAVVAVVFAIAAELDQATDIDAVAEVLPGNVVRQGGGLFGVARRIGAQQRQPLFARQAAGLVQLPDQGMGNRHSVLLFLYQISTVYRVGKKNFVATATKNCPAA